ncbi:transposable element Tcb2 transposase [Trichonephila clavipes]|nr:transposable element Tcb2 transposase [Trichonephila clavipes]
MKELKPTFERGYHKFQLQKQTPILYPVLWVIAQKLLTTLPSSNLAKRGFRSSEAVLILFAAGANIASNDKDGLTALHCASSRGHTSCVETLVTLCGARVNAGDAIGCSPLFYAAAQGHADSVQVLLKYSADPNLQDDKGRTSNHWEKLEEGCRVTSVAAEFGIAHSIVSRLWRQFQTTGTAIRGFSRGRPQGTTPADDRYIVLQARRNRRQTAGEIAKHTTQATGRPISRFTVARRLHGGGLFARRPVRCVPLTPAHRRRRSLWCREHRNWRDNEWGRVLFTDESRFSLSSDSHRILIWRERGSRNHRSNILERDMYGGRGDIVRGGIMLGSRTDLHIFNAGSVNGTRYCYEILLPYVRLFRGAMGLQFLFMDDNAPCHRTVAAEQLLESEDIERMDWPARSSDLNPIEHVWDFLGRRLTARTLPPVTIRELRLALQDEWAAMPQQLIDTLSLSMGRHCETCLAVRGDHIPY